MFYCEEIIGNKTEKLVELCALVFFVFTEHAVGGRHTFKQVNHAVTEM